MKKLLALLLACMMLLGIASAALATPMYLEAAGVTIEVPEGMIAEDTSTEAAYVLSISSDADETLQFAYSLTYIEAFEGKYMEDLTEEEGSLLAQGISASIANPQAGAAEVNGYQLLVVASGDGAQLHYISLLNGWLCDVAVARTDGSMLNEEDIKAAADLLTSIQFDADEAEETEEAAE